MGNTKVTDANLPLNTRQLRLRISEMICQADASHIGSCFSMVEILEAIYQNVDLDKIKKNAIDRDRVIISKGHAAAAVYAIMANFGLMEQNTLKSYCQDGSLLSGHVNHFIPYIEHSTGALGHGLSVGVGISIGLRSRHINTPKCYVIIGDGELHEGSNWEALMLAGNLRLHNLCILIDNNGYGGICETSSICSLSPIKDKFDSFGFETIEINGHDLPEILKAIERFKTRMGPFCIICHTVKGKGVSFMENQNVWHYRPPSHNDCITIKNELLGEPEE